MKGSKTGLRLPKQRLYAIRGLLIGVYFFTLGLYLYQGFQPYQVDASGPERLFIPSISLSTPVDDIAKNNTKLIVPEVIAGAYSENHNKTLLIGHSNTVFSRLGDIKIGDQLTFDNQPYIVARITTVAKENIDMAELLAPVSQPTVILMTCTGQHISGHDYTHRLIITATLFAT